MRHRPPQPSSRLTPDDEAEGTGTQLSSIYALKFGQGSGLMGLEHGGIVVEQVGELETKDATRHRIKWLWTQSPPRNPPLD